MSTILGPGDAVVIAAIVCFTAYKIAELFRERKK